MKFIFSLAACAALLVASGCSKSEPASSEADMPMPTPTSPPASAPADAAQNMAAEAAKTVADTAGAAKGAATSMAEPASSKAQDLISQAKGLVDAKKYTDASAILQQLASLKLTPDQQKLMDGLKTTIQQALAKQATTEGTKAVNDLLGGKK